MHTNLLKEDMKMALETIRTHKVRSFLTVLGVVIGTMVAIVVASILLGVEKNVQDSLNEFGVDNLFIFKFDPGFHFGRLSPEERTRKSLTYEDGMAIKEELPAVRNVVVIVLRLISLAIASAPNTMGKTVAMFMLRVSAIADHDS